MKDMNTVYINKSIMPLILVIFFEQVQTNRNRVITSVTGASVHSTLLSTAAGVITPAYTYYTEQIEYVGSHKIADGLIVFLPHDSDN